MIIGSGWAGFKLLENIDQKDYDVVVISPRNYFVFTPLLASTCVGTLEFRSIVEPIRRQGTLLPSGQGASLKYYEASVTGVDFLSKRVSCMSTLEGAKESFSVGYDKLVIACGAMSNTFNTPGVLEHAHFLKDIHDARRIRYRLMECFEKASQPGVSEEKKLQLLHFVTVGGGPTGIEFSAELHDFITEDLRRLYPELMIYVKMTVFDIATKILSTFDERLAEYTASKFARKGIQLRTGMSVLKVEKEALTLKASNELVPYGLLVWATGLTPNPLVKSLTGVSLDPRTGRLLTDQYCRLFKEEPSSHLLEPPESEAIGSKEEALTMSAMTDVFAIGDCATIKNYDLPCTAQVAKQKAQYLARIFNRLSRSLVPLLQNKPFEFKDVGALAYIGGWRAIARLQVIGDKNVNRKGVLAWLIWRSAYMTMSVSWRNKVLIPIYWFLAWCFGRDISHIK